MAKKAAPTDVTPPPETPPESAATPPVAETPVTPAPESAAPPAPETPPEPSLLDVFKEKGFEGVTDEKTAAQRALEAWEQQKSELEKVRQDYDQARLYAEYGKKYLESAQTQPAPEPEQKTETGWWSPPAVDLGMVRHYQERKLDPATGQETTTWKPHAPQALKDAYDQRVLYQEQWTQKFVENPVEALKPFRDEILAEARELIRQEYTEKHQEQTVEQYVSQFERDNADWLYQKDPVTQKPLLDRLAPDAEQFFREAREDFGLSDPEKICKYVLKCRSQAQVSATAQQASTQAQAAQVADQKRREILARNSAGAPNRNGSTLPPENGNGQQNRSLSLRQKLAQAMHDDGVQIP